MDSPCTWPEFMEYEDLLHLTRDGTVHVHHVNVVFITGCDLSITLSYSSPRCLEWCILHMEPMSDHDREVLDREDADKRRRDKREGRSFLATDFALCVAKLTLPFSFLAFCVGCFGRVSVLHSLRLSMFTSRSQRTVSPHHGFAQSACNYISSLQVNVSVICCGNSCKRRLSHGEAASAAHEMSHPHVVLQRAAVGVQFDFAQRSSPLLAQDSIRVGFH